MVLYLRPLRHVNYVPSASGRALQQRECPLGWRSLYLKPFEEKYFLIATDPEDTRITQQLQEAEEAEKSHSPNQLKTEKQHESTTSQSATAVNERVPQRFVHLHREGGHVHLSADMVIDKKAAAFKLKYPHRIKSHQTLSRASGFLRPPWEVNRISFICEDHLFSAKVLQSYLWENARMVVTCGDHSVNIEQRLFDLKLGHKT